MTLYRRFLTMIGCGLVLALAAPGVRAQHEGDLEFAYEGGAIEIENGTPGRLDASIYFEGAFGVGGPFDRFTSDPGFEAHDPIGAADIIGFDLWSSRFGTFLTAFDPNTNSVLANHAYSLEIQKGTVSVTATAGTGGSGLIGQASGTGTFHHHVNFTLSGNAPVGAYGLLMTLNTDAAAVGDSEPFWLIFNYGMLANDFEFAVKAITGVPEPSSLAVLGLIGVGALTRRRRR